VGFAKQLIGIWPASFAISRWKKFGDIRMLVQSRKDEKVIKSLHETSGINEAETISACPISHLLKAKLVEKFHGSSRERIMPTKVETFTPPNTPRPIGPYNHMAKVGQFISIGGTAGVNPQSGLLAGPDVYSQTKQILESFRVMLHSVGSDLDYIVHVNVFLKDVRDFEEMNRAYIEVMEDHRPARTVIGVNELPKPGVLLTMNLTAVTKE
jgi:2-iminobutanoate/2-iminopropanoate deaminase